MSAKIRRALVYLLTGAATVGNLAWADDASTGKKGIHSQGLGLTGKGIAIGQVEVGRPGLPGFDNLANSNQTVTPSGVFLRNGAAVADTNTSAHAEQVAGVMIANGAGAPTSVAPNAALFSSAYNVPALPGQAEAALSAQHVARQNGGDVRAINFSFGEQLVGGATLNGNSLLTQYVDWSARVHDALYVKSRGNLGGTDSVPRDNYNGINVAATTTDANLVFNRVANFNDFTNATDGRRLTNLLAPGTIVNMPVLGNANSFSSGTSFAAPHVTGTVALLQEFGDKQIATGVPRWDTDARQHEVTKAVLMNSADKIKDDGTFVFNGKAVPQGSLLGMEKTILDTNGKDWTQSDAFTSTLLPLDSQMGTGQLNAFRALTQFKPGEYDSFNSGSIPLLGWDYGWLTGAGQVNKYIFDQPLRGDSFISITLAWDRFVTLLDTNNNGLYDIGETFEDKGLTDLDLYLMPKGETDITKSIWLSNSFFDSVEHIFYQIPKTGEYEFWVQERNSIAGNLAFQNYGLAWWGAPVPEPGTMWLVLTGIGLLVFRVRRLKVGVCSSAIQPA